ncbi:MAG: lysine--tRNA ligase, partial [Bdellovibrionales bacterium]|nr:lysine--tRNA ligase [Bdellovibrionales bacterium]
ADQMYKQGLYNKNIIRALRSKDRIREILKKETGKDTDMNWSPFHPLCQQCGRMSDTKIISFNEENEEVHYQCQCEDSRWIPLAGGGKLTWRVDWPARWQILGVQVEPFGKDHASRGGSYDTGVKIAREIFEYEPPYPVVYEWISLRGAGDMSSSKGNVLSIREMLDVLPAEVLKYSIIKAKPNKSIVFDPGLPMVTLLDEFDDKSSTSRNQRAAELASLSSSRPVGVPFRHVVMLVQLTRGHIEEMIQILNRTGYKDIDVEALKRRCEFAASWLEKFGPEDLKFEIQVSLPDKAKMLSDAQKNALHMLGNRLTPNMDPHEIHELIYAVKDECGLTPSDLFKAIYQSILGKDKGPRAGFFLASMDLKFMQKRFLEV